MHASAVLAFDTKEAAQKALKNQLFVAEKVIRTAVFEEREALKQCSKCQKFGHMNNSCKNLAVCQFCAKNHFTRLHICKICEISEQVCIHT
jgi:hypothetical protein